MKIICIGQNYPEHAREMNAKTATDPIIFIKPETAYLKSEEPFFLPAFSNEIHYEVELVIKINRQGKNIHVNHAAKYYDEITTGIDFTARDIQRKCKQAGHPWELAKGFDRSAAVGEFIPVESLADRNSIPFHLEINRQTVQSGNYKDVTFSFEKIISFVSMYFMLKKGDLIFSGTPAGVGPVKLNDELISFIGDKKLLTTRIK